MPGTPLSWFGYQGCPDRNFSPLKTHKSVCNLTLCLHEIVTDSKRNRMIFIGVTTEDRIQGVKFKNTVFEAGDSLPGFGI
jgi:hypothetical protein